MKNLNSFFKYTLTLNLIVLLCFIPLTHADSVKQKLVTELNQLLKGDNDEKLLNLRPGSAGVLADIQTELLGVTPFIIGGTTAPRSRYREYVLVITANNAGDITGLCGGTMIGADRILTAAHCSQVPARNTFAIPGFYSFNDQLTQSRLFRVSRVSVHPGYNPTTFSDDVAVLATTRNYSGPTAAVHSGSNLLVNRPSTVIGTGLVSTNPATPATTLQEVQTPITSNSTCNAAWQAVAGIRPIQDNMLCAGFPTNGKGSCNGDSGGPLFIDINGQRAIAATVSFGLQRCEINRGTSAYARMASMTDFIRSRAPSTRFLESNKKVVISPIIDLIINDDTATPAQ